MNKQNGSNQHINEPVSNPRRDFIKLCSAATVGGVSSLILPRSPEAQAALDLLKIKAQETLSDRLFWRFVRSQFVLKPKLTFMNTGT